MDEVMRHDAAGLVAGFPIALRTQSRLAKVPRGEGGVGEIPVLLAHPDWERPAPTMIWLHGRTAYKELDPGRYLRWIRAGIAVCAVDLPGHGERLDPSFHGPQRTLEMIAQGVEEVDRVVEYLASVGAGVGEELFDLDRMGIGGMSAGGMVTLRRLCERHAFRCAAVEGTTGNLAGLYGVAHEDEGSVDGEGAGRVWPVRHAAEVVRRVDPMQNLRGEGGAAGGGFKALPLLVLHSEADRMVPFAGQRRFIEVLRGHYVAQGQDPNLIELVTWKETGAPGEHVGFGRVSNEAKNAQAAFLSRHLVGDGALG